MSDSDSSDVGSGLDESEVDVCGLCGKQEAATGLSVCRSCGGG